MHAVFIRGLEQAEEISIYSAGATQAEGSVNAARHCSIQFHGCGWVYVRLRHKGSNFVSPTTEGAARAHVAAKVSQSTLPRYY